MQCITPLMTFHDHLIPFTSGKGPELYDSVDLKCVPFFLLCAASTHGDEWWVFNDFQPGWTTKGSNWLNPNCLNPIYSSNIFLSCHYDSSQYIPPLSQKIPWLVTVWRNSCGSSNIKSRWKCKYTICQSWPIIKKWQVHPSYTIWFLHTMKDEGWNCQTQQRSGVGMMPAPPSPQQRSRMTRFRGPYMGVSWVIVVPSNHPFEWDFPW